VVAFLVLVPLRVERRQLRTADELGPQVTARLALAGRAGPKASRDAPRLASLTPVELRAAVDDYWGDGPPTAEKLRIFDTFWKYADAHYAAFQNLDVDWAALRDRYRGEVAAGVSRGRFAWIMNQLSLALRDSHSLALDRLVNIDTFPDRGVPLLGQGAWEIDISGACMTAQDDGSALVYSALPGNPLGLEPGDRVLGYDGEPWRDQYKRLIREGMPLWPLFWGSSASAFEHSFVMSAGLNWPLFDTMDVLKYRTGAVAHVPTSVMPGDVFWGFCAEELGVPGVPKPHFFAGNYVSGGIVAGTHVGYVYSWAWEGSAREDFAALIGRLTQVDKVEGLIIDLRFNPGGSEKAAFNGLAALAARPTPTIAMDERANAEQHLKMKSEDPPTGFILDFTYEGNDRGRRDPASYAGPVAVLVGPGCGSACDIAAVVSTFLENVRTFGKSTSMAIGLPSQPLLGSTLDLGPDWFARVTETNSFEVGSPKDYLIHQGFPVDEHVWLRPADVAAGRDTVVEAALSWLRAQGAH
jgi:hypothetical protein